MATGITISTVSRAWTRRRRNRWTSSAHHIEPLAGERDEGVLERRALDDEPVNPNTGLDQPPAQIVWSLAVEIGREAGGRGHGVEPGRPQHLLGDIGVDGVDAHSPGRGPAQLAERASG